MVKRKHTSPNKSNPPKKTKKNTKTQCVDNPVEVVEIQSCDQNESFTGIIAEERPWKNLELILSLQSNELGDKEKVELAFSFVKAHDVGENGTNEDEEECQAVKISRLVMYLSDWIQTLFVSKEQNFQVRADICLDFRCWEILRFCLKQSSILDVSINLSKYLLKAIAFIAENLLSALNGLSSEVNICDGQSFEVYSCVVDCVGLLFSSKNGMSNDNLDLWFSTAEPVLKLTHKVLAESSKDSLADDAFVLRFSCLVLEPFSKFLMTHPTKKNGFRDFLDKLFGPFLDVLGLLNLSEDRDSGLETILLKLIQEILSLVLFHPAHIDGFLSLGGAERYLPDSKENKTVLQSYHRHFFSKFENMLLMKNELELSCAGSLFRLFINRAMKQQRDSNQLQEGIMTKASRPWKLQDKATNDNESSAQSHSSSPLRLETRKSLFDFFLHLMEPILLEIDVNIKAGSEMAPLLADLCSVIKSANSLLFHFARERIYVKTEDASGGACFCFFKKIFMTIVSVASQLQNYCTNDEGTEMHALLAKELVTAIGYLLQIEYEVIENDLVPLWLIILSFLRFSSFSSENVEDDCPLTSLLLGLGCQLINLYSDLRQVSVAVFALCKAVRRVIPADGDNEEMMDTGKVPRCTVFLLERSAKSVEKLLSSQALRLAIHRAIKVIPEGQAGGCIKSMTTDVSEAMDWIRVSCSTSAREQDGQVAAFLAGALSDIYSLILDSLTITTGNSNLVGRSINHLVDLIRPCLTHLVSSDSDCIEYFLSAVTGKNLDIVMGEKNREAYRKSVRLFIVFFLRVYMSSRSLYRQVISLMPPKKSKEMAAIMGDSVASRCGSDWVKEKSWNDEGYFSWICQPSASILDIIKHISAIYLKDDSADCSLLIYILYGVALQRLVDLNKYIKSLDYVSQICDNQACMSHVSVLKCEGEELAAFLLGNNIIPKLADVGTFETIYNTDQWVLKVSGIDRKCLPAVRLWVLSQHIDIWCPHSRKENLKNFLSQIIGSSVPHIMNGVGMSTLGWENNVDKGTQKKKTGLKQFSLELLCDSVLYEHEFVRRYMASSFSHVLTTTAETFFKDFTEEVNFDTPADWSEVFILLESSVANLSGKLQSEAFVEAHVLQLDNRKFTACQNLLNLLCGMPKEYMNKKSFQIYASNVLDLERFVVFSMLRCLNKLSPGDMQNLFSLFITCRKTLKSIAMNSCDKVLGSTKLPLSDSSLLASWLFKSAQAAVTCQERFKNDFTRKSRDALFSLLDHTSYMFLTVSKYLFSKALPLFDEQHISSELSGGGGQANHILESLTEQAETLLNALKDTFRDEKKVFECKTLILTKLAPIFSCFSGLLWGLASTVSNRDTQKNHQNTKLRWKSEQFSKLCHIIHVLSNFFEVFAQCLFLSGDVQREIQRNINWTRLLEGTDGSNGLVCGDVVGTSNVKKQIIESFIEGGFSEVVLALRHLLIASAAILRLNLQIDGITFSATFVSVFTGISNDLLSVLADMSKAPLEFSFIWLDGAVKVLEELGTHFCLSDPTLNRDLYSKLIELHLKVIGKCISLQGKEATLESHETGFGANVIHAKQVLSENSRSHRLHWLDELKGRLRMSFKVFIQNSSELHLLSAVQAIERALVGVWEVCPAIYSIQTGNRDGGRISEIAAAGIDCLDLILEHATGRKRLNVVKRHIQGFMSALFGIMGHMQSPFVFCTNAVVGEQGPSFPDAGSVILMCVEVLIRIAGKHALFQMDTSHLSQSIHIPGAIFRDYLQITRVGFSVLDRNLLHKDDQQQDLIGSSKDLQVDQKFSMSLYAACCRLLYTAVKHHKNETEASIATLQESVSALLHCLETAGNKLDNCVSLVVEDGIRCASFLRRIYEELRQQKEVFGQHCYKFLSAYIWVSSGFGPHKTGIKREVDEALRPGVYALIDSCAPNDLQYLHTVFGEGPCRNSLATLQQDYKLNFKYGGKV
uniref:Nucleolar 27S pre-rRNA processing Urb2/Npa2 C-terminal domain-containing protein n=1 Tax=Noccaea caerulescens TaxID=107243 RepID=A0A1J3D896_NOCCA